MKYLISIFNNQNRWSVIRIFYIKRVYARPLKKEAYFVTSRISKKYIFLLNLWWCACSNMLHNCEYILHRSNHNCYVLSLLFTRKILNKSVFDFNKYPWCCFSISHRSSIKHKLKHNTENERKQQFNN